MPKDTRTARQNYEWWIREAERYEGKLAREMAAERLDTFAISIWTDRAADARAKAETYLTNENG